MIRAVDNHLFHETLLAGYSDGPKGGWMNPPGWYSLWALPRNAHGAGLSRERISLRAQGN